MSSRFYDPIHGQGDSENNFKTSKEPCNAMMEVEDDAPLTADKLVHLTATG